MGPSNSTPRTASRSVQPFLQGSVTVVTDTRTDRPTDKHYSIIASGWCCGLIIIISRVLAINVSIPNRTVARLEQFRWPQLRFQPESDQHTQGLTENKPSFIRKHHVVISRSPFAANVVPKLVAMATSPRPSISNMSSLDSLIPKTYP